jgi:hypothetical protein
MTERTQREAERRANARLRHPTPNNTKSDPESEPSVEELAGIGQYEVQSVSGAEPGAPMRSVSPNPAPTREPLSAPPDELGRRFLERAAQTTRNTRSATEPEGETELSPGEHNMLDAVEGEVETEDHLVTRLTLPTG